MSNPEVCLQHGNCVHESAPSFQHPQNPENTWNRIKTCLLDTSNTASGWECGGKRKETWWWNDVVDYAIKDKRRLWKEWQKGEDKEKYLQAKRKAKKLSMQLGKMHKKPNLILKAMTNRIKLLKKLLE